MNITKHSYELFDKWYIIFMLNVYEFNHLVIHLLVWTSLLIMVYGCIMDLIGLGVIPGFTRVPSDFPTTPFTNQGTKKKYVKRRGISLLRWFSEINQHNFCVGKVCLAARGENPLKWKDSKSWPSESSDLRNCLWEADATEVTECLLLLFEAIILPMRKQWNWQPFQSINFSSIS